MHIMDAGPTQEVTPPCSNVQNSPLLKGREQAVPIPSPLAPLKRLHCSQKSEASKWANGSYEACRWGRGWGGGCWVIAKNHMEERQPDTEHLCVTRSLLLELCLSLTARYEKLQNMTQKKHTLLSTDLTIQGHVNFHIWCCLSIWKKDLLLLLFEALLKSANQSGQLDAAPGNSL